MQNRHARSASLSGQSSPRVLKWGDKAPSRSTSGVLHDVTASAGYQAPPAATSSTPPHAAGQRSASLKWGSPRASEGGTRASEVGARRLTDGASTRPVAVGAWGSALVAEQQERRLSLAGRLPTNLTVRTSSDAAPSASALSGSMAGGDRGAAGVSPALRLAAPGRRTSSASGIRTAAVRIASIEGELASARPDSPRSLHGRLMSPALIAAGRPQTPRAAASLSGSPRASYVGAPRSSFAGASAPVWSPSGRPSSASFAPPRSIHEQQAAVLDQQRSRGEAAAFAVKTLRERLGVPADDSALSLDTDRRRSFPAPETAPARTTPVLSRVATIRAASLTAETAAYAEASAAGPTAAAPQRESSAPSAIEAVKVTAPAAEAAATADAALQRVKPSFAATAATAAAGAAAKRDTDVAAAELTSAVPADAEPCVQDLKDIRSFISQPGPRDAPLQCCIIRTRIRGMRNFDQYAMHIDGPSGQFLLAARRRRKTKNSTYIISLDPRGLVRAAPGYCGKLRSNFMGTEFTAFDMDVSKPVYPVRGGRQGRSRPELAAVSFGVNVLGIKGPRKMTAILPRLTDGSTAVTGFRPGPYGGNALLDSYKRGSRPREMLVLRNKAPTWNEHLAAYCLNFNGRVTAASVKNFQLVEPRNEDTVLLQFGKVTKDKFTMDYRYPMTALQAFSICLASFDRKMACE